MELVSACLDIGDAYEGFPYDVGKVGEDLLVCDSRMEDVPGEKCGRSIPITGQ